MKKENESKLAYENGFDRASFKKAGHKQILGIAGKTGYSDDQKCGYSKK
jgi:hypothetical protein